MSCHSNFLIILTYCGIQCYGVLQCVAVCCSVLVSSELFEKTCCIYLHFYFKNEGNTLFRMLRHYTILPLHNTTTTQYCHYTNYHYTILPLHKLPLHNTATTNNATTQYYHYTLHNTITIPVKYIVSNFTYTYGCIT
jgi:hypothetical protein